MTLGVVVWRTFDTWKLSNQPEATAEQLTLFYMAKLKSKVNLSMKKADFKSFFFLFS